MKKHLRLMAAAGALLCAPVAMMAQAELPDGDYQIVWQHYGNYHLGRSNPDGHAITHTADNASHYQYITAQGDGWYTIRMGGDEADMKDKYFVKSETGTEVMVLDDQGGDRGLWRFEPVGLNYYKIINKETGKAIGIDNTNPWNWMWCDKVGHNSKYYFGMQPRTEGHLNSQGFSFKEHQDNIIVNPAAVRQTMDGFGVSLAWWANVCGNWPEADIDKLVDWLTAKDQLNYNIFRYNIPGGENPEHTHIADNNPRAAMQGFKASRKADYDWTQDAAQQLLMKKIHEKRPDAIFVAYSASAPYWMTVSGCAAGAPLDADGKPQCNLKSGAVTVFAEYLTDVMAHMKEAYGIEFKMIEPFNEPYNGAAQEGANSEGCYYPEDMQESLISALYDKINEAGLKTVIGANGGQSCWDAYTCYDTYKENGIADKVGMLTTHAFGGTLREGTRLSRSAHADGKSVWMTDMGGGSGTTLISQAVNLAQTLVHNVRYYDCSAWLDWQMLDPSETWALVSCPDMQTPEGYAPTKNFYVRKQLTDFVEKGWQILTANSEKVLVARNPEGTKYVIFAVNNEDDVTDFGFDVKLLSPSSIKAYRTSESENMAEVTDFTLDGTKLKYEAPAQTATTFVIDGIADGKNTNEIVAGEKYLFMPRPNNGAVLTSYTDGEMMTVSSYSGSNTQKWQAVDAGDGKFRFINDDNLYITGPGYSLNGKAELDESNTAIRIEPMDAPYFRAMLSCNGGAEEKAFDCQSGDSFVAYNNPIGLWNGSEVHHTWLALRLGDNDVVTGINDTQAAASAEQLMKIAVVDGGIDVIASADGTVSVYSVGGTAICQKAAKANTATNVALKSGAYIVKVQAGNKKAAKVVCVK